MPDTENWVQDKRLSPEFRRRLDRYMGPPDPASTQANKYGGWYGDHAGGRSEWFRQNLVHRLEHSRPLGGLTVLDFGCGTGSSTVVVAERGARVVGADTDDVSLKVAAQRAIDLNVQARCAWVRIPYIDRRGMSLPLRDSSVDLCILVGVLEHMEEAERPACANEIARVLRPGAEIFIFDTPNQAHPFDHHTTQLWFLGWMPQSVARRYAIARGRFDSAQNFRRYGGQGVSRSQIDRLFPPSAWSVNYEKSPDEIALEFGWLGDRVTILPRKLRSAAGWGLKALARGIFRVLRPIGGRPAYWTASHTLGLTKRIPPT